MTTVRTILALSPVHIAGAYAAGQAGVATVGGAKVAELKNSKGVLLKVKGKQVELALDLSGMEVSLKKRRGLPSPLTAGVRTRHRTHQGLRISARKRSWHAKARRQVGRQAAGRQG